MQGIVPILEKKGSKVKLVELNDYVQPSLKLAHGSLDANFFQHLVYLQKPNDPSNLARALVLLEQNKLITLKSSIDSIRAS